MFTLDSEDSEEPQQAEPVKVAEPEKPKVAEPVKVAEPEPVATIPTATPVRKVRHDWIQTADTVNVTIFVKGRSDDQVRINITEENVEVEIDLDGSEYNMDINLCDKVVPEQSSFKIYRTKVEINLKKVSVAQWPTLEKSDSEVVAWGSVSIVFKYN